MNWNLIVKLSLPALIIGVVSAYINIAGIETWIWLALYAVWAYFIAKQTISRRFAHGFLTGVAATVMVTIAHLLMFDTYMATNAESYNDVHLPKEISVKTFIIMMSVVIAVGAGLLSGLLAFLAAYIIKPKTEA